jgi:hypothetical protein
MLDFLRDKTSERKLRLFTVACCRAGLALLAEKPTDRPLGGRSLLLAHERRVIRVAAEHLAVAEQYADGLVKRTPVDAAYVDILGLLALRRPEQEPWAFALIAILRATTTGCCYYGQAWEYRPHDDYRCARDAAEYVARLAAWATDEGDGVGAMGRIEAGLLRDIVGPLPFRPVPLDPSLLRWNGGTVLRLAEGIYEERAFDRMPVLGDALLDAGCDDEEVLQHCRQQGAVHARGCWVIDLLLAKP